MLCKHLHKRYYNAKLFNNNYIYFWQIILYMASNSCTYIFHILFTVFTFWCLGSLSLSITSLMLLSAYSLFVFDSSTFLFIYHYLSSMKFFHPINCRCSCHFRWVVATIKKIAWWVEICYELCLLAIWVLFLVFFFLKKSIIYCYQFIIYNILRMMHTPLILGSYWSILFMTKGL